MTVPAVIYAERVRAHPTDTGRPAGQIMSLDQKRLQAIADEREAVRQAALEDGKSAKEAAAAALAVFDPADFVIVDPEPNDVACDKCGAVRREPHKRKALTLPKPKAVKRGKR